MRAGGAAGTVLLNQMPGPVGTVPVHGAENRSVFASATAFAPTERPSATPARNAASRPGSSAAARASTSAWNATESAG